MAEKTSMKGVQKNLSIEQDVLARFETFCNARGSGMGYVASAALLAFMKLSADERDRALLDLDAWIAGDPEARKINPPAAVDPVQVKARKDARSGFEKARQRKPRRNEAKTGEQS